MGKICVGESGIHQHGVRRVMAGLCTIVLEYSMVWCVRRYVRICPEYVFITCPRGYTCLPFMPVRKNSSSPALSHPFPHPPSSFHLLPTFLPTPFIDRLCALRSFSHTPTPDTLPLGGEGNDRPIDFILFPLLFYYAVTTGSMPQRSCCKSLPGWKQVRGRI